MVDQSVMARILCVFCGALDTVPVLTAGAGAGAWLSGFSASWHSHELGLDFRLIEACDRVGAFR